MNKKSKPPSSRNPVAKNAHKFNKSVVFKNRKAYSRKPRTPRDGADSRFIVA